MGAVYKARDTALDVVVAVKLMTAHGGDAVAMERFRSEVIAARGLQHDNIVNVHGFHSDGDRIGFSMEYLDGASIQDHLDGVVPGSPLFGPGSLQRFPLVADIADQLCHALDYVHGRQLVHRDIKPSNVMLLGRDGKWHVKLADFGLVHVQVGSGPTGEVQPGTLDYMAPELLSGNGLPTPSSDLFSLGKVVYLVLTGRSAEVTFGMQTPSQIVPGLPPSVDDAVMACLMDAHHRPSRARAVASALNEASLSVERAWAEERDRIETQRRREEAENERREAERIRRQREAERRRSEERAREERRSQPGATHVGFSTRPSSAAEGVQRDAAEGIPERSPAAETSDRLEGPKSPVAAAALCWLFMGGGGYFYLGQQSKGFVACLVTFLSWFIALGWIPAIGFTIDAYMLGSRRSRGESIGQHEVAFGGVSGLFRLLGVKDD